VHDPCSLRHVLRQAQAPYRLLQRIPGIELLALPDNQRCCGAAGSYMLSEPENAERLRDDKIAALRRLDAEILVTSNLGCALHLRAGIRAAGLPIEVMHPVALIDRQLHVASSN
jgi:glycolate oxidase iron-sulfur subunit